MIGIYLGELGCVQQKRAPAVMLREVKVHLRSVVCICLRVCGCSPTTYTMQLVLFIKGIDDLTKRTYPNDDEMVDCPLKITSGSF